MSNESVSSSREWIRVVTRNGPTHLRKSTVVEVAPYEHKGKAEKFRLRARLRVFDGEHSKDVFVTDSEADVMKHLGWGAGEGDEPRKLEPWEEGYWEQNERQKTPGDSDESPGADAEGVLAAAIPEESL